MKKTIVFSILAASALSLALISPLWAQDNPTPPLMQTNPTMLIANASSSAATTLGQLEKILSPDQIKNFQAIKKIGNSLYGVKMIRTAINQERKQISSENTSPTSSSMTASNLAMAASSTSQKLEKIAAPALIGLYEKIQKIGSALWGIRKLATSTPMIINEDISACVSTAINVKDLALVDKINTAATNLVAAINARSACQQTAIQSTDNQSANLNACVKTFQAAQKSINDNTKTQQQSIQSAYATGLKACAQSLATTSVPVIDDGGEAITDTITGSAQ